VEKSGPIHKLEKVIVDALMTRGMTEGEAMAALHRVEEWAVKAFNNHGTEPEILQEKVTFYDVDILHTTDLALLCRIEGENVWIPFSQLIREENEIWEKGDTGTLVITQWIAEQKNLI